MYLIDGNNVMGQRPGWHRDRPAAQRRLLNELAELSRLKRLRFKVVFDGSPLPNFPDGSRFRGVEVFFARPGSDADSRIVEFVECEQNRHNLTVVTSDQDLIHRIRAEGVKTLRSGELRRLLDSLPHGDVPRERAESQADVAPRELEGWMRYFGVDEENGEED